VALAGTATTDEDTAVTITLRGTDADAASLAFHIVVGPAAGTLGPVTQLTATTAQVTYTPNHNSAVDDGFSFAVSDGTASSVPAAVAIRVRPVNDPPVAITGTATTFEGAAVDIVLTGSDPEGRPLTFQIATRPSAGTLSAITPLTPTSARVTYTPAPNASGHDSFRFTAHDATASSAPATIAITVVPVDDPPTAITGTEDLDGCTGAPGQPDDGEDCSAPDRRAATRSRPGTRGAPRTGRGGTRRRRTRR